MAKRQEKGIYNQALEHAGLTKVMLMDGGIHVNKKRSYVTEQLQNTTSSTIKKVITRMLLFPLTSMLRTHDRTFTEFVNHVRPSLR